METIKSEDEIVCIMKLARTYWDQNLLYEHRRYAVNGFHTAIDMVLAKKPEGISLTEEDFCDMLELADTYWVKNYVYLVRKNTSSSISTGPLTRSLNRAIQ
jgi:hypothetical protein